MIIAYVDCACSTDQEAEEIIETGKPIGRFLLKEEGWFVGIDNTRGD